MSITGAWAAAMLAAASSALAQVTPSQPGASPWPTGRDTTAAALADTAYIRQAIRGNYLEVALGRLAESRAADSDVKEFGQRTIADHNSMNEQWSTLARNTGMRIDLTVDPAGKQSIERLEDLSGAAFDQAYMAEIIRQHEQDLAAFQRMAASARSTEVRQLANSGVPTIREHLTLARQIGSRVGVATTAGRVGGVPVPVPTPSDTARRPTTTERTKGDEGDERNDRSEANDRPPLPAADRAFVRDVVSDHRMHIRLAKRAEREARRDDTRELAERIEKDFTKWEERWRSLADRRDLEVPSGLERADRQKIERLEGASERGFDRTYVAMVANHLETVVQKLRKERQDARSPVVSRMVDDELPVIREHLARARKLQEQAEERAEASDRK
jgi:putative membrane protein